MSGGVREIQPAHLSDPLAGKLRVAPCSVKAARKLVRAWHRHLPEIQGGLFAASCLDEGGNVVAVAVAGNPCQAWQGTGRICISRVAASVGGNACGMLYGALARAAGALGYQEAWTYTLPGEDGRTLHGAGFIDMGLTDGGEWDRPSRPRKPALNALPKRRWVRELGNRPAKRMAEADPPHPLDHSHHPRPETPFRRDRCNQGQADQRDMAGG